MKRIKILQKKAIRIINKAKSNDHTNPLFLQSEILPYDKLVMYYRLNFMHSIYYKYAPKPFADVFPKNESRNLDYNLRDTENFTVPFAPIDFFKRFPLYNLPYCWNHAGDLTFYTNQITFQIALKQHLFMELNDD